MLSLIIKWLNIKSWKPKSQSEDPLNIKTTNEKPITAKATPCEVEFMPERPNTTVPRFFCQCERGYMDSHAVMGCSAKTMQQKIMVQWTNSHTDTDAPKTSG